MRPRSSAKRLLDRALELVHRNGFRHADDRGARAGRTRHEAVQRVAQRAFAIVVADTLDVLGEFFLRDRLAGEGERAEAQIEREPVDGGFDLRRSRIGLRPSRSLRRARRNSSAARRAACRAQAVRQGAADGFDQQAVPFGERSSPAVASMPRSVSSRSSSVS